MRGAGARAGAAALSAAPNRNEAPPFLPAPAPTALRRAPAPHRRVAVPQDARTRLVCNPLRFAANYAVLSAGATALSALARPLDLLLCASLALALFAGGSQRAFDAAWPHLHPWAIFDVMGAPLLVDGVCVKLNGFNVGNEQTLWGLPRLVWGFASAALAAVLVARNPAALATTALGALSASGALIITHALLKPLPEFGGAPFACRVCASADAVLTLRMRWCGFPRRDRGLLAPDADAPRRRRGHQRDAQCSCAARRLSTQSFTAARTTV